MTADIDCIVVGAGVVGLAVARELALRGREVMVIEQHDRVGAETSSRNSEVIHAGLYYPPGSLKARLCVEGKDLLYRFAADNGVAVRTCGKLLVATSQDEVAKLDAIAANAAACGVSDLVALTGAETRQLESELECVAAYLSPSTGVIDSHGLMTALQGHIQAGGGQIVLATRVERIIKKAGDFRIVVGAVAGNENDGESLSCRTLVLATGLHTTPLASGFFNSLGEDSFNPSYRPPATYFAKGHYFTLSARVPFSHLIYPMPRDGGLGVHLTLDTAGGAKFGPDVAWVDAISYDFDDGDGARRAKFIEAIWRWWPELPASALNHGYTGVRPKLTRAGEPAADFAIHGPETHGVNGLVGLYGIESPGLTAALAIARQVARQLA